MSNIYIPENGVSLSNETSIPQIRLGVQGPPGTGKTFSALTFPNPLVADFNRGLGAHVGRDIPVFPFYNGSFCDKIHPRDGLQTPPNRKDAYLKWIANIAVKLAREQSLIVDSLTELEMAYHTQYKLNPVVSRKGKEDGFAEWTQKIEYFDELNTYYKALQCDLVLITHETIERVSDVNSDDYNKPTGAAKALLSGLSGDKIAGQFTDWFRSHSIAKPKDDSQRDRFTKKFANDDKAYAAKLLASTPKEHETIYLWQTQADENFKSLKTSSLFNAPKFVIAHYNTFAEYRRKISPTKTV